MHGSWSLNCLIMHAMLYKYSELEVYDIPELYYNKNSSLYFMRCSLDTVDLLLYYDKHASILCVPTFQNTTGILIWT